MAIEVKNILIFRGSKDKIHALMESVKSTAENGEERPFDFGKVLPIPENVYKGNLGIEEEKLYPGELNWYGWCSKYWHTKWNAFETEVFEGSEGEGYSFLTAWNPPHPVIEKLAENNPSIMIIHLWASEDLTGGYRYYVTGKRHITAELTKGRFEDQAFAQGIWRGDFYKI